MKLHFDIVRAGIWQATERPDIQLRKMPRTLIGRNGYALPGWAVFVGGREVRTCGREATKRHAAENAEQYTEREQADTHAGETLALLGLTPTTHVVKFDGTVMPREGIPCIHPESARKRSGDVWHPDTCGGCGEPLPDIDATPTLGPADLQARVTAALAQLSAAMRGQVLADLPPAPTADPATDDNVPELTERIVRRAQYEALRAVYRVLLGWAAGSEENCRSMHAGSHPVEDCLMYVPNDIARMLNDAADELHVPKPVEL